MESAHHPFSVGGRHVAPGAKFREALAKCVTDSGRIPRCSVPVNRLNDLAQEFVQRATAEEVPETVG